MNIKGFTGWPLCSLGLKAAALLSFACLVTNEGKAQTNFASAQVLYGDFGSVSVDNTGITADTNAPSSIAGQVPKHPVWFQWSTTNSGEVTLDTIGSYTTNLAKLDTVLGVYSGTNLTTLSLISANDDLYPVSQANWVGQNYYSTADTNYSGSTNKPPSAGSTYLPVSAPFQGPSELHFNAVANTTYYFAVDTKGKTGPISLNWALHPAGVFRFATENSDLLGLTNMDGSPMLLYPVAATESVDPKWTPGLRDFNALGALVTVTRVAGSSGRMTVDYYTTDISALNTNLVNTNGLLINGDAPAVANQDYFATQGTITFDDYEMSKTILIPIINYDPVLKNIIIPRPNRDFAVVLTNAMADPSESADVSQPRVDTVFNTALVRILDVNSDPKGLSVYQVVTNIVLAGVTNTVTNTVYTTVATNSIFNFQKANFRVYRAGTNAIFTIYVNRTGTNTGAASVNYIVNNSYPFDKNAYGINENNQFPLQPGSDYATPTPINSTPLNETVSDFNFPGGYSGTLNWAANDNLPKAISFTITNNGLQQFNEDFQVNLYNLDSSGHLLQEGMVASCSVTILNAHDLETSSSQLNPPAGAVDELFNPDNADQFWETTTPISNPGADGEVYGMALQPDGNTVVVGDFYSYDQTPRNCIARATSSGYLDTTFDPGQGADDFISCVTLTTNNEILIGGNFTSYNGSLRNGIALVNTNGAIDTSFAPGNGFNGTVSTLLLQPNGQVLVGGNFTQYNGVTRNYIARLNLDGTLDTTFNPGTNLNASVDAMALQANGQVVLGGDFTSVGGVSGQNYIARLNTDGSLDTTFDPGSGANGSVYAVGIQPDGNIVIGGNFTVVNGQNLNGIARMNSSGVLDPNFYCGTGLDGPIYNITINTNAIYSTADSSIIAQTNFTIYVGGEFTEYNGTHRLGFARLNSDGTLDTTFLDTAYNQFAGLTREYYGDSVRWVDTSVVQPDGDVLIGGTFDQLGGGQFNPDTRPESFINAYPTILSRSAIRKHNNFARLHGGATPGPGNIGLAQNTYSVNKSAGYLAVDLTRTNGFLGAASVNLSVSPGLAQSGVDYFYDGDNGGTSPLYESAWSGQVRMHSDGLYGANFVPNDEYNRLYNGNSDSSVYINVYPTTNSYSDLNADIQLSNPANADQYYLGGENIPLGIGLGECAAPMTLVEDRHQSGTFSFASPNYTGTGLSAPIAVTRTNGNYGQVAVTYSTTTNGSTAIAGSDYRAISGATLTFQATDTNKTFNVQILSSNYVSTVEKTVNLLLTRVNPPTNGNASLGITNAVLRIINPNFQGFLNLSASNYNVNLSAGSVTITVTRTVGSKGTLTVQCATTNGTATNGIDYIGSTNTLQWNDADVSPKTIVVPLINNHQVGSSKQFGVLIYNPTNNTVSAPSLFAANGTTNAVVTITNDNSYGTFQFSAPSYVVNEQTNGYSTITVTRTGATNGSASIQFATTNGTAFAGTNYITTNGILNFAPGQLAASFTVPILDDGIIDPPPSAFYFTVTLSNPSAGAFLGSPAVVTNYIVDAESFNRPPGNIDTTFNSGTGMNGDVQALALQSSGQIIAGGSFTAVNGTPESYLARLNADGTLDNTGFLYGLAGANDSIYALADQTDDKILVGGAFTSFDNIVRNRITRLNTDGSVDSSFNPGAGADNIVYGLAETFIGGVRKIYLGGAFSTVNGISLPNLARLNDNGTVDVGFTPGTGPNGPVYAVAAYPTNSFFAGKLMIGGAFTNVNNFAVGCVARLNADGSMDTSFDLKLNASGTVRAIAIQSDGKVLIGGDFTNVDGTALNHIARLNSDGSLDTNFTPGAAGAGINGAVNSITVQPDGRIVVVGQFSLASGVTRNGITRLLPNGAVDPSIDFGDGANGAVDAVVVQPADQMIVIGGDFTQYNDQSAGRITRIYGGSETGSGEIKFTSSSYQIDENGVQALIGVRRTGGTSGPNADGSGNVMVNFTTSDGTATNGINYNGVNVSVSFPPGEVLKYVPVTVMDDSNITPNLTVNLTLSNPTAPAILGDQPNAVLTIINDDSAVNFSSGNYSVAKNVPTGFGMLDVTRVGTTEGTSTVDYFTTTNGTAVSGTDYYPTNGTITFNPGDTDKIIYVPIINNNMVEGNRTLIVALTNSVGTLLYAPSNTVLTIVDTVAAPGQLFLSATNYVAGSGDGNAYITVLRTNGTSGSVSATYSTQLGTALPGVNYNTVSGTVSFNDGDTVKTFAVPLINNPSAQVPVSLTVLLSNISTNLTVIAPSNAVLTIINTNLGFAFTAATNAVSESAHTVSLLVSRLGNTNGAVSVNYGTTNGTAVAGTNFTAESGTLTFGSGETLKAIVVPLIDDPAVTGDLLFTVGLTSTDPNVHVVAPSTTTVVEHDADAGLSFTNASMSVLKNSGVAVITVVCSNPSIEPVIVDSNTVPLSVHYSTADGTAQAGVDYTATSGTLVFTNLNGTNTFTVPINNNTLVASNKTFTITLSDPTAPGELTSPSVQTVTIINSSAGLEFSKPTYSVFKNGVAATINVYRVGYTDSVVSVNFLATNGTAVAGINYLPTNGTLMFTNGVTNQTFTVPVIATTATQPDLSVLLQLFNPTNGILVSPNAATLIIRDNTGSFVEAAGAQMVTNYTSLSDYSNNIIGSNDTVQLLFAFRAAGGTNVSNLIAYLLPTNGVVSPSPASQSYGSLVVSSHSVSMPFIFTAHGTNNSTISPTFQLYDGANSLGTASFTFTLGSWATSFTNSAAITINDDTYASPYPAIINVSGVGSSVLNATVTLTNVNHASPRDIAALLVSPSFKDTLLMAGAGSTFGIHNVTLKFDDAASSLLPQSSIITSGTNKPTAYLPIPNFP